METTYAPILFTDMSHKAAESLLYELWYSVAETLFERVCTVTELEDSEKDALRQLVMRPNDFHVHVTGCDETNGETNGDK